MTGRIRTTLVGTAEEFTPGDSLRGNPFRGPENRTVGGGSAEAWGPTTSPQADFGASGAIFVQQERPCSQGFSPRVTRRGSGSVWIFRQPNGATARSNPDHQWTKRDR